MSALLVALAWLGLFVGLVVLLLVVWLFTRVMRPALEVKRYVEDTRVAVENAARNVEGLGGLARTRELAEGLRGLVVSYLRRLEEAR